MNITCEVIKDLLPLYHDGVCSGNSKVLVDEHLSECASCKSELEKLNNSTLDDRIQIERDDIVGHHAKAVKRKSLIAGISVASIMAVPILVCLIVNLATGHALDWFFIVLTAIMTAASVTVVPLVMDRHKLLWTLGTFTRSLTLLLLTCCLYSGGDWFFVAEISILFGLSVLFMPFLLANTLPLKGFAANNKGLLAMAIDTLLLFAVVTVSVSYGRYSDDFLQAALLITTVSILLPWVLFLIIRYSKQNGFVKAGLCTIIGSISISILDTVINLIINSPTTKAITNANFSVWQGDTVDANIQLIIIVTGLIVGGILLVIGLLRKKK